MRAETTSFSEDCSDAKGRAGSSGRQPVRCAKRCGPARTHLLLLADKQVAGRGLAAALHPEEVVKVEHAALAARVALAALAEDGRARVVGARRRRSLGAEVVLT